MSNTARVCANEMKGVLPECERALPPNLRNVIRLVDSRSRRHHNFVDLVPCFDPSTRPFTGRLAHFEGDHLDPN